MSKLIAGIVCAALAACGIATAQTQPPKKTVKDEAEYKLYSTVLDDLKTSKFAQMLTDLDAWRQKYPDSDFRDDRELLYVKGNYETKQPQKALEHAGPLLAKDFSTALSGPADPVNLLLMTSLAIQQIPDPSPEQLALGEKAARQLATYDKAPTNVKPEDWAKYRVQLSAVAQAALLYTALTPGSQALKKKDCPAAESALKHALEDHPMSAQAAALYGEAELCLYKTQPEKIQVVLYEYARAASLDPAQATVDPKWQQQMEVRFEDIYRQYHGDDAEGLKQVKAEAVTSPFPPDGFAVKSKAQIAQEQQDAFEKSHPELTLWLNIKSRLTGSDGAQYFDANMKDAMIPQLLGTLVEAKPACRPATLLVALSKPDGPVEVELKLDKALPGAPEPHSDLRWEGLAKTFSPDPFLLTMEVESAKIGGLTLSACGQSPKRNTPKSK